jgi:predicted HD phosphohydrolase
MLAHHSFFQGYYFWHHLGLDRDGREKFRESPYYDYTEEFCAKYDQVTFDSDYRSEPLEHFEPLFAHTLLPDRARRPRPQIDR